MNCLSPSPIARKRGPLPPAGGSTFTTTVSWRLDEPRAAMVSSSVERAACRRSIGMACDLLDGDSIRLPGADWWNEASHEATFLRRRPRCQMPQLLRIAHGVERANQATLDLDRGG